MVKRRVVLLLAVALAACQQAPATLATSNHPRATVSPTPLSACALGLSPSGPQVLLHNLPAPDDLVFQRDGRLLFSDITAGTVSRLNPDGSTDTLATGLRQPEGMVVLDDGRLLVAEQGQNRVVAIDPQSHAVTAWRIFPNHTANAGIDGIGPIIPTTDAAGRPLPNAGDVVVPDSPNGVVWAVTPDGKNATRIGGGMSRPVGAAIDASGRLFIADERGAVWALTPARQRFTTLPTPDDVAVSRAGDIFVNTIGDNAIHQLDAQGHQLRVLSRIAQPQGIALDGADNLYYTEFTGGRIDRVVRTFLLQPATVTRLAAHRYRICPSIARAAGFSDPLSLTIEATQASAVRQSLQPGTGSSGALEVETAARSISITVSDDHGSLHLSQTVPLSG